MILKALIVCVCAHFVAGQGSIPRVKDTCFLDPKPGDCKAYLPSFYYNKTTKYCDCFVFSGCDGNENRYETIDECMFACNVESNKQIVTNACRKILRGQPMLAELLNRTESQGISNLTAPKIDIQKQPSSDKGPTSGSGTINEPPFQSLSSSLGEDSSIRPSSTGSDKESSVRPSSTGSDRDSSVRPSSTGSDKDSSVRPSSTGSEKDSSIRPSNTGSDKDSSVRPSSTGSDKDSSIRPSNTGIDKNSSVRPSSTGSDKDSSIRPSNTGSDKDSSVRPSSTGSD